MTTMGPSQDFQDESFRRLVVNACFWALGFEDHVPPKTNWGLWVTTRQCPLASIGFAKE
jgi:hypothetical protein